MGPVVGFSLSAAAFYFILFSFLVFEIEKNSQRLGGSATAAAAMLRQYSVFLGAMAEFGRRSLVIAWMEVESASSGAGRPPLPSLDRPSYGICGVRELFDEISFWIEN
jgi:hypothetical protein